MLTYRTLQAGNRSYGALTAMFTLLSLLGFMAARYMEHEGHYVTGMTNQIVWGIPHVVAIFLILAASGVLNIASISSVFNAEDYKPLARLSGLLAITLLLGGLLILVLDLGRPDRLIVAMTTYNFRSIFAWNIFLYTGFAFVVLIYLWIMMDPRLSKFVKPVGAIAFSWRLILTTGTGSIFGFLVAREAYDTAIMAPLFIVHSLAIGTAVFILIASTVFSLNKISINIDLIRRLGRLLLWFVLSVAYMVAIYHLTNLYISGHHNVERFILKDGGIYTWFFWGGQVVLGYLVPIILLVVGKKFIVRRVLLASVCTVIGAFIQIYVLIIGGQAYPLNIFPGYEVISGWHASQSGDYFPTLPEFALSLGGIAFALLITIISLRVLPLLPSKLKRDSAF